MPTRATAKLPRCACLYCGIPTTPSSAGITVSEAGHEKVSFRCTPCQRWFALSQNPGSANYHLYDLWRRGQTANGIPMNRKGQKKSLSSPAVTQPDRARTRSAVANGPPLMRKRAVRPRASTKSMSTPISSTKARGKRDTRSEDRSPSPETTDHRPSGSRKRIRLASVSEFTTSVAAPVTASDHDFGQSSENFHHHGSDPPATSSNHKRSITCAVDRCKRPSRQDCAYLLPNALSDAAHVCKAHCDLLNLAACVPHKRPFAGQIATPTDGQDRIAPLSDNSSLAPEPSRVPPPARNPPEKHLTNGTFRQLPGHASLTDLVVDAARSPGVIQRIRQVARPPTRRSASLAVIRMMPSVTPSTLDSGPIASSAPSEPLVRFFALPADTNGTIGMGAIEGLKNQLSSSSCFRWDFATSSWDQIAPLAATYTLMDGPFLFFLADAHDIFAPYPPEDVVQAAVIELRRRAGEPPLYTGSGSPAPSLRRTAENAMSRAAPPMMPFTPTATRFGMPDATPPAYITSSPPALEQPRSSTGSDTQTPSSSSEIPRSDDSSSPDGSQSMDILTSVPPAQPSPRPLFQTTLATDATSQASVARSAHQLLRGGTVTIGAVVDFFRRHPAYGPKHDSQSGRAAAQEFHLSKAVMPEATFNRWRARAHALVDRHSLNGELPADIAARKFSLQDSASGC